MDAECHRRTTSGADLKVINDLPCSHFEVSLTKAVIAPLTCHRPLTRARFRDQIPVNYNGTNGCCRPRHGLCPLNRQRQISEEMSGVNDIPIPMTILDSGSTCAANSSPLISMPDRTEGRGEQCPRKRLAYSPCKCGTNDLAELIAKGL